MSESSPRNSMKLMHLHAYNIAVDHKLYDPDHEANLSFVTWWFNGVYAGISNLCPFCLAIQLGLISADV
jgi:hypothetical protein